MEEEKKFPEEKASVQEKMPIVTNGVLPKRSIPFKRDLSSKAESTKTEKNAAPVLLSEKEVRVLPESEIIFHDEEAEESRPEKPGIDGPFAEESQEDDPIPETQRTPTYITAFDWAKTFLFSLIAVIFVFTLLFRGVTVSGPSMNDTLQNNDYLIISDLFFKPKTGDIVVAQSSTYKNGKESIIKRVIATGGQTVRIDFVNWRVWVDGEELQEDYIKRSEEYSMLSEDMTPDSNGIAEVTVEEGFVFVMGDNRNDSLDSRSNTIGQIDERHIMGKVLIRLLPFSEFGKVN